MPAQYGISNTQRRRKILMSLQSKHSERVSQKNLSSKTLNKEEEKTNQACQSHVIKT